MNLLYYIPLFKFFNSTNNKTTIIKFSLFLVLSILSLVNIFFSVLTLVLFAIFTLCEFDYRSSIWFLLFILPHPFSPINFVIVASTYFAIIMSARFVVDIIKHRIDFKNKITSSILILFGVAIVLILTPIAPTYYFMGILLSISFFVSITILLINYEKLDIKRLFIMFSMFVAIICIVYNFFALLNIVPTRVFYIDELERFNIFIRDPNFTAGVLICAIACLLVLFKNNDINKKLFYPLYTVITTFAFHTISKAFLICFVPLFLYVLIDLSIKYFKTKTFDTLIDLVGFLSATIIAVLLSYQYLFTLFNRFHEIAEPTTIDDKASVLTTGRTALWEMYIVEIFSSASIALFGHGSYSAKLDSDPHNTLLGLAYDFGIILCLIILAIYVLAYIKNYTKFNLFSIFSGLCVFVMYMSITALINFQFYAFLILFALIAYNKPKQNCDTQSTTNTLNDI